MIAMRGLEMRHQRLRADWQQNSEREIFRRALVQCATIVFVIVCGVCALLVYYVLEPFLHSILWSLITGAFLFPLKKRWTSAARHHLRQLDTHSHLLLFSVAVRLPWQLIDGLIESIGPVCCRQWKHVLFVLVFLPSMEFLHAHSLHEVCSTAMEFTSSVASQTISRLFDCPWINVFILVYILAILTIYNYSPRMTRVLKLCAIPVWSMLLVYLSQYLSITYRWVVVVLVIILTAVGFISELRERSEPAFTSKSIVSTHRQVSLGFPVEKIE